MNFFATHEEQLELVAEASSWLGTPFLLHGRKKGFGVDCLSLVAEIYLKLGVIDEFAPGFYSLDGGNHAEQPILDDEIAKTERFDVPWRRPAGMDKAPVSIEHLLVIGDLLVFKLGRIPYHCSIYLGGGRIIQALAGPAGVSLGSVRDSNLSKRFNTVYRPLAL